MVQGTADWTPSFLSRLSRAFGMRVLSVDYKLCPQHTATEAVESMVAAFLHVTEDIKVGGPRRPWRVRRPPLPSPPPLKCAARLAPPARRAQVPAKQVLLVGESGGGQATLLTLQALVRKGLPVPAAAWVSCPVARSDEVAFARHGKGKADGVVGHKGTMRIISDLIRRKVRRGQVAAARAGCGGAAAQDGDDDAQRGGGGGGRPLTDAWRHTCTHLRA